jgi:hypothetical protein
MMSNPHHVIVDGEAVEQELGIRNEPGWIGAFTREDSLGAWRAGARIEKVKSEEGDAHPVGDKGTVLGSITHDGQLLYFVEWDDTPRTAVAVIAWKIGPATQPGAAA